jgi:hypothetical protein
MLRNPKLQKQITLTKTILEEENIPTQPSTPIRTKRARSELEEAAPEVSEPAQ